MNTSPNPASLADQPAAACGACGQPIDPASRHTLIHGVTSDCRPWPVPHNLFSCTHCGLTQTETNSAWRESARQIYASYQTYAAADGAEQKVGTETPSILRSRSHVIVDSLRAATPLPATGHLLDVGCGRGAFLQTFNDALPGWHLDGVEFDERNLPLLTQIAGFRQLRTQLPNPGERAYDAISLIHVLEHLERPVDYLRTLALHSAPNGLLIVQVPDCAQNPFALTITDHATHFNASSLESVVRAAGWEPLVPAAHWVPKELTLIARHGPAQQATRLSAHSSAPIEPIPLAQHLSWLRQTQAAAHARAQTSHHFGLFGTAIAATWLHHGIAQHVHCFVDEDPQRIGRQHLGTPIVAPHELPAGMDVFIGLAPVLAQPIATRLTKLRPDVQFHLGPPLKLS